MDFVMIRMSRRRAEELLDLLNHVRTRSTDAVRRVVANEAVYDMHMAGVSDFGVQPPHYRGGSMIEAKMALIYEAERASWASYNSHGNGD